MPKLWESTVDQHRHTVHAAILDATAALVAEHGMAVNMSQIAAQVGIGRATLYKYFPDVQSIVIAWHDRQVTAHLDQLAGIAAQDRNPGERLRTVLATYLHLSSTGTHAGHGHHADGASPAQATQLALTLHRAAHMPPAHQRLHELVTEAIAGAADAGIVRTDAPPAELATYCLHALAAAAALPSPDSRERLLDMTWAGLLPPG
ncbi:helix-turn-helix domain-containing protein [Actinoplanes sp. NPDC023801]|uniref:TetR/AcrR family transcriptional regulator n=1 Tax=Actinoplanes sp. NPDC023801 TaxID=3154595 RepID=UPI0033DB9A2D